MNKSFAIRFLLAAMMAVSVAVTGCSDDPPAASGGTGGSGGTAGTGGVGGGGMGGDGGMGGTPVPLSVSADPAGTTFASGSTVDVTLEAAGDGSADAIIYYTTDLSEVEVPTGAGGAGGAGGVGGVGGVGGNDGTGTQVYAGPITITDTTVVKFVAVAADDTETSEELEGYTLTDGVVSEQWAESGHGDIVADAWRHWDGDGEVDPDEDPKEADGCAKCHGGVTAVPLLGFLQFAETGANADAAPLPLGLECAACHSEDTDYPFVFDAPAVVFPSELSATYDNASNLCMSCHQGRESKVQVDETIAASAGPYGFLNIHYFAAAATLFGTQVKGGYEYDTKTYVGQNTFAVHEALAAGALTDCLECHMNAATGDDQDHTFMPEVSSCATSGCHSGASFEELSGSPASNYTDIQTLIGELLPLIETYADDTLGMPIVYSNNYPYFCNDNGNPCNFSNGYQDFDATLLKAAYNYQTGLKDPGGYIHNGDYIKQLLFDSIEDLGGTPGVTRP